MGPQLRFPQVRNARGQPAILEKSATLRVAARISDSRARRLARSAAASVTPVTLTVTLSKKASTGSRSSARARMAPAKSFPRRRESMALGRTRRQELRGCLQSCRRRVSLPSSEIGSRLLRDPQERAIRGRGLFLLARGGEVAIRTGGRQPEI
jgi:hypothetical protein